jgi:hypothetical protein
MNEGEQEEQYVTTAQPHSFIYAWGPPRRLLERLAAFGHAGSDEG